MISLLAKNSPKAQKLYRDQGSTTAYDYVEMVVKEAQRQLSKPRQKGLGNGL